MLLFHSSQILQSLWRLRDRLQQDTIGGLFNVVFIPPKVTSWDRLLWTQKNAYRYLENWQQKKYPKPHGLWFLRSWRTANAARCSQADLRYRQEFDLGEWVRLPTVGWPNVMRGVGCWGVSSKKKLKWAWKMVKRCQKSNPKKYNKSKMPQFLLDFLILIPSSFSHTPKAIKAPCVPSCLRFLQNAPFGRAKEPVLRCFKRVIEIAMVGGWLWERLGEVYVGKRHFFIHFESFL